MSIRSEDFGTSSATAGGELATGDRSPALADVLPVAAPLSQAIARLCALKFPQPSPRATEDDLGAHTDFLEGVREAIDPLILAVGESAKYVAPGGMGFDLGLFRDVLKGAFDGLAYHELQRAADVAAQEFAEAV